MLGCSITHHNSFSLLMRLNLMSCNWILNVPFMKSVVSAHKVGGEIELQSL